MTSTAAPRTQFTTPGDTDIVAVREFAAPRGKVWVAYTPPRAPAAVAVDPGRADGGARSPPLTTAALSDDQRKVPPRGDQLRERRW